MHSSFTVAGCVAALLVGGCTEEASPHRSFVFKSVDDPRCLQVGTEAGIECRAFRVSLVELLSRPDDWDRERIITTGFIVLEFEHTGLYLSRDDVTHFGSHNGVRIRVDDVANAPSLSKGEFVIVEGVFDALSSGHNGSFNGTLVASSIRKSEL